ncbi:MAG TPA: STAS domain-containing protein [Candidatus Acidoferrales bacterium]|nr:STAS domain-containing protein [Candidatus Acidoferrales bacterium]
MKLTKKEIKPGIVVFELSGNIRMGSECQQIGQEVEEAIRRNEKRVILDVSQVEQVDSAGVGKIVQCYSWLTKAGGSLRLAGAKGMVDTVLKLTQVHKVIGIYPTAADAAENFPLAGEHQPPNA